MSKMGRVSIVLLLCAIPTSFGARILGLMTMASHSHYLCNRQFLMALANRGHHLTVATPDVEPSTVHNYRHIHLEGVYGTLEQAFNYEELSDSNILDNIKISFEWGQAVCNLALQSNGFKALMDLAKNETFDLIILETGVTECFLGLIAVFGHPPVVGINLFESPSWVSDFMGNPHNPSFVPAFMVSFSDRMTFMERLINVMTSLYVSTYRQYYHMPALQDLASKYMGENLPNLADLERNISLTFVNIDHRFDYPRPLVPGIIPIAGLHVAEPKPLPQDIQKFLDGAKDGVIYFSLGSNIRSDKLQGEKITSFVEAFRELPQRVLWKWESDSLPGQPPNVMTRKWLPQSDVLAHPKVKVFISHCGLMGTQEAISRGVPVVGVPIFIDQHINLQRQMDRGVGLKLDYNTLTKETILETLREALHNDSYRKQAVEWSRIFRDRPMSSMDTAIFWTEYVLRHRGAPHLRSAALHLSWCQYLLLDVLAAFLISLCIVFIIALISIRKAVKWVSNLKPEYKSKSQ